MNVTGRPHDRIRGDVQAMPHDSTDPHSHALSECDSSAGDGSWGHRGEGAHLAFMLEDR